MAVGDAVPEGIKSPAEVGETKAFNLENPTLEEYQEAFEHSFDMAPSSMVNIHIIHETPPDQAHHMLLSKVVLDIGLYVTGISKDSVMWQFGEAEQEYWVSGVLVSKNPDDDEDCTKHSLGGKEAIVHFWRSSDDYGKTWSPWIGNIVKIGDL